MDFRDFNKSSPKDNFPLLHIDILVDNAAGHALLSFMMFGLKNAGATYQRATTTLLHDMIHKEVEVYVDDMIER